MVRVISRHREARVGHQLTVLIDLERAVTGIGRSAIRHLNLEITHQHYRGA
jgi:hypothetical protein